RRAGRHPRQAAQGGYHGPALGRGEEAARAPGCGAVAHVARRVCRIREIRAGQVGAGGGRHGYQAGMNFSTRVTELLGIRYPILQAGMSWASSHAELALAVSQAGALGVIAAGPMYPDALREAIRSVKARTDKPFAVNVPLYNPRAATFLDIVIEERVPIIVASQGRPKQHTARFKAHGVTWLHVTASPEHAGKAEAAGVDAVIAVGTEAGGHPPPDEVGSLVVVRAVVRAVSIPVIGGGGVAD